MDKIKVETDLFLNLDGNINNPESMIKCEEVEGPASDVVVKQEYDCYNDGTVVNDGNMELTQGASIDARAFVERLLNDNVNRGSTDLESKGHECINEEIMAYEQNHQVSSKVKQEKEFQEDTILKKEIEFVDVQETNDTVGHCLYKEKRIWNNDTGRFEQYSEELETEPLYDLIENEPSKSKKKKDRRSVSLFNGYIQNLNNDVDSDRTPPDSTNVDVMRSTTPPSGIDRDGGGIVTSDDSDSFDENRFQCHLCEHRTNRKHRLREHIDVVHFDYGGFQCSSCDFRSSDLDSVKGHLEEVHPPQKTFRESENSVEKGDIEGVFPPQKTFKCDVCDCEFKKKSYLTSHVNSVHPDSKNLNCPMCDYVTTKKSVLKRHVEAVHSKEKNFKCTLCEYRAYSKNYLKDHVESVHSEQKNFKCQMCGYGTNRKTHLAFHVNAVHLKRKDFKCQMCDYACSRKVNLKRHVDAVHSKQKNYSCKFCDYQAYSKFSMKVHTDRIHSREDSFKCNQCSYQTCMKSSLVTHVNIVHLKLKNYKCQLCDHATTRKGRLRSHMEAAHSNWKEDVCS